MNYKTQHDKYKRLREEGHDSMSSTRYDRTRGGKLFQALPEPIMK